MNIPIVPQMNVYPIKTPRHDGSLKKKKNKPEEKYVLD